MKAVESIGKVELNLRQLWKFFNNSPKCTDAYLNVQFNEKKMNLTEANKKIVLKKLKKACQTRWLSFDKAVTAVHEDLGCILHTLS